MVKSILVWYLMVGGYYAPVQLGPYSDLDSCKMVAKSVKLVSTLAPSQCVEVNIPVAIIIGDKQEPQQR